MYYIAALWVIRALLVARGPPSLFPPHPPLYLDILHMKTISSFISHNKCKPGQQWKEAVNSEPGSCINFESVSTAAIQAILLSLRINYFQYQHTIEYYSCVCVQPQGIMSFCKF